MVILLFNHLLDLIEMELIEKLPLSEIICLKFCGTVQKDFLEALRKSYTETD